MERIRDNYATSVKRGSLAEDEMERRLARIHPVAGYDDIKDCDIVVEAVFERDGRQEAGVRQAGRGDEPGRAAVLQYLGAGHGRAGGG